MDELAGSEKPELACLFMPVDSAGIWGLPKLFDPTMPLDMAGSEDETKSPGMVKSVGAVESVGS